MSKIDVSDFPGVLDGYALTRSPFREPRNMWEYVPAPGVCFVELLADWSYRPGFGEGWMVDGLENAVNLFAGVGLPQWYGHHFLVLDSLRTVVLGYSFAERHAEITPYGWWLGVRAGFSALERHHDPLECAIWEQMAMDNNGGTTHAQAH